MRLASNTQQDLHQEIVCIVKAAKVIYFSLEATQRMKAAELPWRLRLLSFNMIENKTLKTSWP